MHYTDSLIESTLVEEYKSHAAQNQADQIAAEKAYKDELVNGPQKPVYYANGITGQKRIGSFDLDNFHKAYDKYYEDNNLLDLFDDNGKLKSRGSYGTLKNLDKKIPAVKALFELWGLQFGSSNGLIFLSQKIANQQAAAAKQQIEDEQKKLNEDVANRIAEAVMFTPAWKELVNLQPKPIDVKLDTHLNFNRDTVEPVGIFARIENVLIPPKSDKYSYAAFISNINSGNLDRVVDEAIDTIINKNIPKLIEIAKAINYLTDNTKKIKSRPEWDDILTLNNNRWIWLCYYSPLKDKYYKTKSMDFDISSDMSKISSEEQVSGIMLINVNDQTDKVNELTDDMKLVAMRGKYSYTTGNCYYRKTYTDYFNHNIPTKVLTDLGIDLDERGGSLCQVSISIDEVTEAPYNKYFDTYSHYYDECDSSD